MDVVTMMNNALQKICKRLGRRPVSPAELTPAEKRALEDEAGRSADLRSRPVERRRR
jgi:hypothetical protein